MTAPQVQRQKVGFRHCQILAIAADGYPASTGTTAYEGVTVHAARALTLTDPEPRQVVHVGDDRVWQLDSLPANTPMTGELRTGMINDDLDAVLTDDLEFTIGEIPMFGIGTDNRGDENQVIVLAYAQALASDPDHASYGSRRYDLRLLPKALVIPREDGFEEGETPPAKVYTVRPQFCTQHAWGVAFAVGTEGFTRAQALRGVSQYKPRIAAFQGDGSTTDFLFNTTFPAASTDKVTVFEEGAEVTTGITKYTTGVTWTTAPTDGNDIVVIYEHE